MTLNESRYSSVPPKTENYFYNSNSKLKLSLNSIDNYESTNILGKSFYFPFENNNKISMALRIFYKYSMNELNKMSHSNFSNFFDSLIIDIDKKVADELFYKVGGKGNINFDQFLNLLNELTKIKYNKLFETDKVQAFNLFYSTYLIKTLTIKEDIVYQFLGRIKQESEMIFKILNLHKYLLKILYQYYFSHENQPLSQQQKEKKSRDNFIKLMKDFLVCPSIVSQRDLNDIFYSVLVNEKTSEILSLLKLTPSPEYNLQNSISYSNLQLLQSIDIDNELSLKNKKSNFKYNGKDQINKTILSSKSIGFNLDKSVKSFKSSKSLNNNKMIKTNSKDYNFDVKPIINNDSIILSTTLKNSANGLDFDKFIIAFIITLINEIFKSESFQTKESKIKLKVNGKVITSNSKQEHSLLSDYLHFKMLNFYKVKAALDGKLVTSLNASKFNQVKQEAELFSHFEMSNSNEVIEKTTIQNHDDVLKKSFYLNQASTGLVKTAENNVLNEINFNKNYKEKFFHLFLYYSFKKCEDYPFFYMNLQEISSYFIELGLIIENKSKSTNFNDFYNNNKNEKKEEFKSMKINLTELNIIFARYVENCPDTNQLIKSIKYTEMIEYKKKFSISKLKSSGTKLKKSLNFKGFIGMNYEVCEKYLKLDLGLYFSIFINSLYCKLDLTKIKSFETNTINKVVNKVKSINYSTLNYNYGSYDDPNIVNYDKLEKEKSNNSFLQDDSTIRHNNIFTTGEILKKNIKSSKSISKSINFKDESISLDKSIINFGNFQKSNSLKPSFSIKSIHATKSQEEKVQIEKTISNSKYSLNKYDISFNHIKNAKDHLISSESQLFTIELIKSNPQLEIFVSEYKKIFYNIFLSFSNNSDYITYNRFLNYCLVSEISSLKSRLDLCYLFKDFVLSFDLLIQNCHTDLFEINYSSFFDLLLTISIEFKTTRDGVIEKIVSFLDFIIKSKSFITHIIKNNLINENRRLVNLISGFKSI